MKRLIVCCDGTWNHADAEEPTNVVKISCTIAKRDEWGIEQRVFYSTGVGTARRERIRGGMFGYGLSEHVEACYRFLVATYEPGDEIFFFGYSRGAFTARSTAGLLRNCGILRRENVGRVGEAYDLYRDRNREAHPRGTKARLFRRSYSHEPRVKFIGVFDTVGSLGIPLTGPLATLVNRHWQFHDTDLSSQVDYAYHALAIDEKRGPFRPTLWNRRQSPGGTGTKDLQQVWFTGSHADVGGGRPESALAEIPLLWMVERARAVGLRFHDDAFSFTRPEGSQADARNEGWYVAPDPQAELGESRTGPYRLLRPWARSPGREEIPDSANQGPRTPVPRHPPWRPWSDFRPGARVVAPDQSVAWSAICRRRKNTSYGTPQLISYLSSPDRVEMPVRWSDRPASTFEAACPPGD